MDLAWSIICSNSAVLSGASKCTKIHLKPAFFASQKYLCGLYVMKCAIKVNGEDFKKPKSCGIIVLLSTNRPSAKSTCKFVKLSLKAKSSAYFLRKSQISFLRIAGISSVINQ